MTYDQLSPTFIHTMTTLRLPSAETELDRLLVSLALDFGLNLADIARRLENIDRRTSHHRAIPGEQPTFLFRGPSIHLWAQNRLTTPQNLFDCHQKLYPFPCFS